MPNNKKKNKLKKKSSSGVAGSASAGDDSSNLNHQVLEALTRLADTLAHLDEACYPENDDGDNDTAAAAHGSVSAAEGDLVEGTARLSLGEGGDATAAVPSAEEKEEGAPTQYKNEEDASPPATASPTPTPLSALPLSHWRALPLSVTSAYQILEDGANYIHATSTKYTLVGKVDSAEGGNLAVELRKGAELIGTGTLLLFSKSCGSSRSLRHYVKQSSRAILASTIALVKSFDDGLAQGKANDGNNLGAQKTGAVWSACDNLTKHLPRGNRAAMRRELLVWAKDCNESINEFEEVLELGPREEGVDGEVNNEEGDDGMDMMMMDEEQYTEREIKVAKSTVNVMKCSKNLLGLVLKTCECVGEHADKLLVVEENPQQSNAAELKEETNAADSTSKSKPHHCGETEDEKRRKEMLHYISNLHEMARTVGEGVTNCGILLYPPLDSAKNEDEFQKWQQAKKKKNTGSTDSEDHIIPSLGSTSLGLQLEQQLHALSDCIASVHNATLPISADSIENCMSKEVLDGAERLTKALKVRCKEVEEGMAIWG